MGIANYGNDRVYIIAWLERDGFEQLALSVRLGKLSARFAKELATTVPRERLNEVIAAVEQWGPRRPPYWQGWEDALSLAAFMAKEPT